MSIDHPSSWPPVEKSLVGDLIGQRCILTPYTAEYVPIYHRWMSDPTLLALTASEPLSLSEEYANQRVWQDDPTKRSFIILDTTSVDDDDTSASGFQPSVAVPCGDINALFNAHDDEGVVEVSVMVAETASQRKGIASEAIRLLMDFVTAAYGYRTFIARIASSNAASLMLFESLSFERADFAEAFDEWTLRRRT